ncbi:hypothetical protein SOHN41_01526 [Shewanella sp. HN-41]|nr:hypothetical protein SOHN41_01526 [Shewanella sp. HN-41]
MILISFVSTGRSFTFFTFEADEFKNGFLFSAGRLFIGIFVT